FFKCLRQDPVLAGVKLIAEPWDIGHGGYQLGRFPSNWLEWNDRFRDTVRRFWRGDKGQLPDLASRLHGSSDLFEQKDAQPCASVNFITSHDGFSLADLVSFEQQNNYANGENNHDGHKTNFSANNGIEGDTDNHAIKQIRLQQQRNLLATLFLAQGTPMLLAGDEFGNSQSGNNNAYCQDNEISWMAWQKDCPMNHELFDFVSQLITLRKVHPLLNRSDYQHGEKKSVALDLPDISWLHADGRAMQDSDWHNGDSKCIAMLLASTQPIDLKTGKQTEHDHQALLIILNAHTNALVFELPLKNHWQQLLDTSSNAGVYQTPCPLAETTLTVPARSTQVLVYSNPINTKEK
ncbi:MAG: glycogen debranching enzyme GlgX, partial [Psychrosphaera sp.]|nr:glycogen debranching enzyme GlgX [Psychrosphaera sp.]